jgi:hypothetical protein
MCSTVYLAKNVKTGVLAAVKAVSSERVTQQKMLDSLISEINILQQVAHPSIVKLLENTWREVWGFALVYVDTPRYSPCKQLQLPASDPVLWSTQKVLHDLEGYIGLFSGR